MRTPNNWTELVTQRTSVPEFRSLRPGDDSVVQFTEEGKEYLAVRGVTPYGDMTQQALQDPEPVHLMPAVAAEADYWLYEVPEETISIQALTLGTGEQQAESLGPVYHRIGQLLRIAETLEAKPQSLAVTDVAFNRRSGAVTFIPPVEFVNKDRPDPILEEFKGSLVRELGHLLSGHTIQYLSLELTQGMHDLP